MVTFVHIADERDSKAIARNGLKLPRRKAEQHETENCKFGIFALPLTPNFIISHQWLRELKSKGFRTAVGVYFRINNDELVWAGKYNEEKVQMTAAEAAGILTRDEILGFEVIIQRSIKASEVSGIRQLTQVVGWRHFPEAHGRPPFCGCSYCQRGNIKSKKIQQKYEESWSN